MVLPKNFDLYKLLLFPLGWDNTDEQVASHQ